MDHKQPQTPAREIPGGMRKIGAIAVLVLLFQPMDLAGDSMSSLPQIARWYDNRQAAVSFRFDDSLDSHVKVAIPVLDEYGYKGTFMVNPETRRFQRNRDFWVEEVPKSGHLLGNHTMHHRGARDIEEAHYEIGEPARMIRDLYPHRSKLMVFASGGGEKWGGKFWERADPLFKDIPRQYHLIDLYDGNHPAVTANSNGSEGSLLSHVDRAIENRSHQPFVFHNVGHVSVKDRIKSLINGYNLSFPETAFRRFLDHVKAREESLWIAPLVDVLKYENEFKSSRLETTVQEGIITSRLTVDTDPELYDQKLTLILPVKGGTEPPEVYQDGFRVQDVTSVNGLLVANVLPVSGEVTFVDAGRTPTMESTAP